MCNKGDLYIRKFKKYLNEALMKNGWVSFYYTKKQVIFGLPATPSGYAVASDPKIFNASKATTRCP